MKYLRYFLIACVALIGFVSGMSKNTKPSEGIYPGDILPDIQLSGNESQGKFKLSDLRGQKVLVNLWAAYNAQSHCNNVLLANTIKRNNYQLAMVSLSFDESKSVFEKTIAMDAVGGNYQFWLNPKQQNGLQSLYKLKNGFRSYLLDENGKIIAMNVSAENLGHLMNQI